MSVYESSITNPKKQLEFYKQLSEQLQQENKELKEINEEHKKLNGELREENKQLKQRINKAVEYTNKNWGTWCTHHLEYMTELQDILKEV